MTLETSSAVTLVLSPCNTLVPPSIALSTWKVEYYQNYTNFTALQQLGVSQFVTFFEKCIPIDRYLASEVYNTKNSTACTSTSLTLTKSNCFSPLFMSYHIDHMFNFHTGLLKYQVPSEQLSAYINLVVQYQVSTQVPYFNIKVCCIVGYMFSCTCWVNWRNGVYKTVPYCSPFRLTLPPVFCVVWHQVCP